MRLFKLTFATIFHRKAWVICAIAVGILPFILPYLSTASEKPVLVQPARIQAAWGALWISALCWGLFTAAQQGENNAKTGVGEYFLTTGMSITRQLLQIWLAIFCYILPFTLIAAAVSQFAALPAAPAERAMWWVLNSQYVCLFLIVIAPLLLLSTALASRFGGITGFAITLGLALYGLYGVGYLDNMLKLEPNAVLRGLWIFSPHYHFADITQRLYFKSGAIAGSSFGMMVAYFLAITAVYGGISRLSFRARISS